MSGQRLGQKLLCNYEHVEPSLKQFYIYKQKGNGSQLEIHIIEFAYIQIIFNHIRFFKFFLKKIWTDLQWEHVLSSTGQY